MEVKETVKKIISRVKSTGDKALFYYSKKYDGVDLPSLRVSRSEIKRAYQKIDTRLVSVLKRATKNIYKFHSTQFVLPKRKTETEKGVQVWREFRAVERVGLYAPGGKAAYPSTVLMLGIPAKIAGCPEIILCSPPDKNGRLNPAVLVAADLVGIKKIYKVGGAQAIAALAYGTKTIPRVLKIFGPGNQFVTAAKLLLYGQVDIDMPAGPSEIMILADQSAVPKWVAADLLSQLEHGPDSQAVLVTPSRRLANEVFFEVKKQAKPLNRRAVIDQSLKNSCILVVDTLGTAYKVINEYAPEHLEIIIGDEVSALRSIKNAGSVFLGPYSSEPLGDYATGANHTLPTAGYAKTFSALSVEAFGKTMQVQKVSKKGMAGLRKTVETLASTEGLDAHKKAVELRFE